VRKSYIHDPNLLLIETRAFHKISLSSLNSSLDTHSIIRALLYLNNLSALLVVNEVRNEEERSDHSPLMYYNIFSPVSDVRDEKRCRLQRKTLTVTLLSSMLIIMAMRVVVVYGGVCACMFVKL
jgi:hypothetical protein